MAHTDPRAQLPLTAVVLHILLALADGERHGYAIAKEIDTATDGAIPTGPGTLYGSIQRMLDAGLITEAPRRSRPDDDDARRRYYRMTALGKRTLAVEVERLAQVVDIARSKRVLRGTGAA